VSVPTPTGTRIDAWWTVHAVDGKTGDMAIYYVPNKTPGGHNTFQKWDMYKSDA
jgi:hypothetical protein